VRIGATHIKLESKRDDALIIYVQKRDIVNTNQDSESIFGRLHLSRFGEIVLHSGRTTSGSVKMLTSMGFITLVASSISVVVLYLYSNPNIGIYYSSTIERSSNWPTCHKCEFRYTFVSLEYIYVTRSNYFFFFHSVCVFSLSVKYYDFISCF